MSVPAGGRVGTTAPEWEIGTEAPGALRSVADIWTYRRLLRFLASRSLQKIYRRTILGWLWLFIRPLFPLALRTLVFGALLGVTSEGIPYFLFLLIGTVVWEFFATALMWGTRALEMHGDIQDVYVPRVIMPVGGMALAYFELAIHVAVLAGVTGFYWLRDGQFYLVLGPSMLFAAAALLLAWLFAVAISLFTAVWSEQTRDTRYALAQLIGIWYLLTPILYPMSAVPESWRPWMLLNPMAPIVNAFKFGVLGVGDPHLTEFALAGVFVLALLGGGMAYFARRDAATIDAR